MANCSMLHPLPSQAELVSQPLVDAAIAHGTLQTLYIATKKTSDHLLVMAVNLPTSHHGNSTLIGTKIARS